MDEARLPSRPPSRPNGFAGASSSAFGQLSVSTRYTTRRGRAVAAIVSLSELVAIGEKLPRIEQRLTATPRRRAVIFILGVVHVGRVSGGNFVVPKTSRSMFRTSAELTASLSLVWPAKDEAMSSGSDSLNVAGVLSHPHPFDDQQNCDRSSVPKNATVLNSPQII